jgi:DNA (cytosine-5)-methyltransferase 1
LTFGSLFTGIGGFDLGFERAGMTCKWQVEIDEKCQGVLSRRWPNVEKHRDVKAVGKHNLTAVDIICGGFPCQDLSVAGKRTGLAGERSGLWHEFARVVRELEPRWVVVENVAGLLSNNSGRDFGTILRDLAACGYDAEWDVLPAAAFGAPHVRERVFLVAYTPGVRRLRCATEEGSLLDARAKVERDRKVPDTQCERLEEQGFFRVSKEQTSPIANCGWWTTEPALGRVVNGVPNRVDRLKQLGNAIVPQVAEWIGRRIIELDNLANHDGLLPDSPEFISRDQTEVGKPVAIRAENYAVFD